MAAIPQNLLDEIRDLKRRLRSLEGRANIRPAMDQVLNGDVIVGEGGVIQVYPPGNVPGQDASTFATGLWTSQEGVQDYGTALRRQDGSQALTVGGNPAGTRQVVRLWSADGQGGSEVIVTEDAFAYKFLGRPWMPVPMSPPQPVTSSSWQITHVGRWIVQNPVIVGFFSIFAPASTTCEARLAMNDGSGIRQLGDVVTATNGEETFAAQRVTVPDHNQDYGDAGALLYIQVRRTSGTGTGTSWCHGVWGDEANSTEEA